ncbi:MULTISPECIES: galactokinase [unclassified Lacinutrix]
MSKKLIKEVKKSFEEHFKTKPLMVFAPGRINLIGEHTDYNDGFVFPAAINKGIVLAIQKNKRDTSTVFAINKNDFYEFKLKDLQPIENGGWRNYILGVVGEILDLGHALENFDIAFAGNVPGGAGLSSSAALENSVVYALNKLFKLKLTKKQMILISQKAEHKYAGVKCGIMDQYASMFGIKKSALLLDCKTVTATPYKIDFKDYTLMLINTNVKHDLSESAYNDRRSVCEAISKKLNVNALREVSIEDLNGIKEDITEEDYQKALYVIEENLRVHAFAKYIDTGDLEMLGALLNQSHNGLSTQYKVSCEELDFLATLAKENQNVLGARMMGGGFGGCTINLVLKSEFKNFKKEASDKFQKRFGRTCNVYKVKLSKGTNVI